jgi:predicted  nucleic acid-binding Zn-ribbon protein
MQSLERRISSLEDDELEVMEKLEDAQRELDAVNGQIQVVDTRIEALVAARDEKIRQIDTELADVEARRTPAAEGMPDDLIALYDRLREQKGVAAAALRARQCGGCQLTIDNAELAVIRQTPADQVVRCEECQRILIRTPESGL